MPDEPDVIGRALEAAHDKDPDRLRKLIDWPLSGAAGVAADLLALPEVERAAVGEDRIWALYAQVHRTLAVNRPILWLLPVLAATTSVSRAVEPVRDEALAEIRPPADVPGVTAWARERLAALGGRLERLSDVFLLTGGPATLTVAVAPDSDRLVLLRPTVAQAYELATRKG